MATRGLLSEALQDQLWFRQISDNFALPRPKAIDILPGGTDYVAPLRRRPVANVDHTSFAGKPRGGGGRGGAGGGAGGGGGGGGGGAGAGGGEAPPGGAGKGGAGAEAGAPGSGAGDAPADGGGGKDKGAGPGQQPGQAPGGQGAPGAEGAGGGPGAPGDADGKGKPPAVVENLPPLPNTSTKDARKAEYLQEFEDDPDDIAGSFGHQWKTQKECLPVKPAPGPSPILKPVFEGLPLCTSKYTAENCPLEIKDGKLVSKSDSKMKNLEATMKRASLEGFAEVAGLMFPAAPTSMADTSDCQPTNRPTVPAISMKATRDQVTCAHFL